MVPLALWRRRLLWKYMAFFRFNRFHKRPVNFHRHCWNSHRFPSPSADPGSTSPLFIFPTRPGCERESVACHGGTRSPTGPVFRAPGSLARRRLVRVIHHHPRQNGSSVGLGAPCGGVTRARPTRLPAPLSRRGEAASVRIFSSVVQQRPPPRRRPETGEREGSPWRRCRHRRCSSTSMATRRLRQRRGAWLRYETCRGLRTTQKYPTIILTCCALCTDAPAVLAVQDRYGGIGFLKKTSASRNARRCYAASSA